MNLCRFGRPLGINSTSSLKVFCTGGERVPSTLLEELRIALPGTFVTQGYAQTETSGLLTAFNRNIAEEVEMNLRKTKSCGKPLSIHNEYKVNIFLFIL